MRSLPVMLLGALLAAPGPLAAQAWDAPALFPPRPADELGGYVLQPPFGDWGLAAIWRQTGPVGLGVRAAYLNLEGDESAFAVGAEFFGPLLRPAPGSALEAAWTLGAGATFDGGTLLRVPAGVSLGARLGRADLAIVPFAHPRLALEALFVDGERVTEWPLTLDLGVDLAVGRSFTLRAAAFLFLTTLDEGGGEGDDGLAVGVVVPFGRPVAVR